MERPQYDANAKSAEKHCKIQVYHMIGLERQNTTDP